MYTLLTAGQGFALVVVIALLLVILLYLATRVKVVSQSTVYVIERLGKYYTTWTSGLHFLMPFVDRVKRTYRPNGQPDDMISLKEQVLDFAPQAVITKDNVTMQIDTVVFLQITDSKL